MPTTALIAGWRPAPAPVSANDSSDEHYGRRCLSQADERDLCIVGFELADEHEHRLRTMGLFEGQSLRLVKKSNPVIIKVAGARMALAREIADRVFVATA